MVLPQVESLKFRKCKVKRRKEHGDHTKKKICLNLLMIPASLDV